MDEGTDGVRKIKCRFVKHVRFIFTFLRYERENNEI